MSRDKKLTEILSGLPTSTYSGEVYRGTRVGHDPLAPSHRGGRWAPVGEIPVLYTSLEREGALAEIVFHWSQLFPLPSKPIEIHRISLTAQRTLRLIQTDLESLGVDSAEYSSLNYQRTQLIGAEVSFLGFDGLLVTSARWNCENLVLFMDNHHLENDLRLLESEEVDWKPWAIQHGFLDPEKS